MRISDWSSDVCSSDLDRRDRANGLVGTITGVSFAITSVFSGLAIGQLGMGWALYGSLALTVGALAHLHTIRTPETAPAPRTGEPEPLADVAAADDAIRPVPGLAILIAITAFNNLHGGECMEMMDSLGIPRWELEGSIGRAWLRDNVGNEV